ncbi:VWD domain-containing protein, partial [Phytoactinopolyspora halophila]|uniref:VWD domain-containing protein n=1 Tax=Phytoactinopolyspora halophila TaxID=1981511 RepID=UPI0014783F1D
MVINDLVSCWATRRKRDISGGGTMRRLWLFVAALLVTAFFVPVQDRWSPSVADAAAECSPNSDSWTIRRAGERDKRCVFNHMYSTRKRIKLQCLKARPQLGTHIYQYASECSPNGGIESIGQARAIKYLSDRLGRTPPGVESNEVIDPEVQWETVLGGGMSRPDIVYYDRVGSTFAHVIEAKVADNQKYEDWSAQVARYSAALEADGIENAFAGTVLNQWGPYEDWFQVYGQEKTCKTADGTAGYVLRTFRATSPEPGLLHIEERKKSRKCEKEKRQPGPEDQAREEPEDVEDGLFDWDVPPVILPVIQRITPATATSLAGDVAAYGSVEAAAANMTSQVERYLATQTGQVILREAGFLTVRAAISSLGIVGCIAMIYMFWLEHEAGSIKGEPHFITNDGLGYDLQSVGEFIVARSEKYNLEVQGRLTPAPGNRDVSVMFQAATEVSGYRVEFDENDLYIDGELREIADGDVLYLGDDSYIVRTEGQYVVAWDGLHGPVMSWRRGFARVWLPPGPDNDLEGLLGNGDGNPDNDLRLSDGTQLPADTSPEVLHADFADSWRITNDQSFFSYAEGESTETFTDLEFPEHIVTVHDLSPDEAQLASEQCEQAGMPAGVEFNSCVLDLAITADETFADASMISRAATVDPQAQSLDENGNLDIDYETEPMASNVVPSRVSSDEATTSFAGSFGDRESYRFYVQELPPHVEGTLTFDVLAIGDWAADEDTETITVTFDRDEDVEIEPVTEELLDSGTLESGVPFNTYRVSVPFTHTDYQAEVTFKSTGVTGLADQAYGLDNITFDLEVLPPESFHGSLPLEIDENQPDQGAGHLESAASQEVYTFDLPEAGSLYVDPQQCLGSMGLWLDWHLVDADENVVAERSRCRGKRIDDLSAGTYELVVNDRNGSTGTYSLNVTQLDGDVVDVLTVNGAQSSVTTTSPGQNVFWSFDGTAGQEIGISLSDGDLEYKQDAKARLRGPDGSVLVESSCGTWCLLEVSSLPADGEYTLEWDPDEARTGTITAQAYELADITTELDVDGPAVEWATTHPGQQVIWSFEPTVDEIGIAFTNGNMDYNHHAEIRLRAPDGSVLVDENCGLYCTVEVEASMEGQYTLEWDPRYGHVGSITARAFNAADVTGEVAIDGDPVELATTAPGQQAVWSFDGQEDQQVLIEMSDGTLANYQSDGVMVLAPDGSQLLRESGCGVGCVFDPTVLPQSGTYQIVFDPDDDHTGALTAQLYEVPDDVTGEVVIDADAVELATTAPGQRAVWSFDGQQDQQVFFELSDGSLGTWDAAVSVVAPDGSELLSDTSCGTECAFGPTVLPQSGTYQIVFDPDGTEVGSLTAQLYEALDDVTGEVVIDGDPVELATTAPGQRAVWSFDGQQDQEIELAMSSGTLGTWDAAVSVVAPDGSELLSDTSCGTECVFDPAVLPQSGTYQIVFDPDAAHTGSITAQVREANNDVTGEVVIDGDPVELATTAPGQRAVWSFDGQEDQRVFFEL